MYPSKLLIDGTWVEGDRSIGVVDPATGEEFARCGAASLAQLNAAVAAARAAQPAWWRAGLEHRQACLIKIADILEAQAEPLARLIVLEQGKTLAEARIEVVGTVAYFRYYADQSLPDEVLEKSGDRHAVAQRRPHGVVAAIVPWNYPVILMVAKVAPALVVGNAVVVKPAATTPLSTLLFGELVHKVLPAGVLNIIVDNNDLGDALTSHPGVQKISFTGSTATGRKVMASAAGTLKRLTLELGGNDPALVLDDADPDAIAPAIYGLAFPNAGQLCVAIKRVYVPDALYERFCTAIAGVARQTVLGSGLDPQTTMGPLQNRKQHERVLELIEDSRAHGTIVTGGNRMNRPGYFVEPTIVRDITDGTRLVDEEQFGPVLPVIRVGDTEDAVARANASSYGLGASVWTKDVSRGLAVAEQLEAGMVWVNKHFDILPHLPLAGFKQSGLGAEFGIESLREMTQLRVVNGPGVTA